MLVLPFLFAFLGLTLLSSAPLPFTLLNVLTLQTSSSIYIPLVGPSSSSLVSVLPTRSYPTVDWTPCPDYIVEVLPPSRVLKGFAPVNNDTDVWPTSGSGLWMFIARNVAALCLSGVILAHKASNKVSDKVTLVDVEEIQKTAAAAAACGEHSISRSASPAARPSSASTLAVPSHQPVDLLELAPQGTCPPPTHPYPHVPSVQRALATDVSLDHGDQPVVSAPLDSHLESDTDDEQFLYPVSSNDDDLTSVTPSPIDVQQFLPSNSPEDASPLGSMHSTSKALLKRKMDVFSYKLVHILLDRQMPDDRCRRPHPQHRSANAVPALPPHRSGPPRRSAIELSLLLLRPESLRLHHWRPLRIHDKSHLQPLHKALALPLPKR
ncbi:hypothetical protein BV25DRAFT_1408060 [Artomyces pyxidatus]|uniref:Uncharacterized protein n=1 Tax=Artomyces pyxidatus TaxID=48021 RepID=A0ACB8TDV0_9AGAM|nr:hypothetical protein BV25DRAFT_1408060 [Artomyces pyxidatus]